QEEPAVGDIGDRSSDRRGEVVAPLTARVVLTAESGVLPDLLVGRLRVPEEVAGRVHPDHYRAVDAGRVAPRIDHRRACPGALAQEVDALVAERLARRLQIVDLLRQAVAGQIDTVVRQSVRAGPERVAVGAKRLLAE